MQDHNIRYILCLKRVKQQNVICVEVIRNILKSDQNVVKREEM